MSPTTRSDTSKRWRRGAKPDLDRARQAAKCMLAELDLVRPTEVDIADLAAARGVLMTKGLLCAAEARLAIRPGRPALITASTAIKNKGWWRFCIAHELGHFVLHADHHRPQVFDDAIDDAGQKGGT